MLVGHDGISFITWWSHALTPWLLPEDPLHSHSVPSSQIHSAYHIHGIEKGNQPCIINPNYKFRNNRLCSATVTAEKAYKGLLSLLFQEIIKICEINQSINKNPNRIKEKGYRDNVCKYEYKNLKNMGKCSKSFTIQEMQMKTALQDHFTPLRLETVRKIVHMAANVVGKATVVPHCLHIEGGRKRFWKELWWYIWRIVNMLMPLLVEDVWEFLPRK